VQIYAQNFKCAKLYTLFFKKIIINNYIKTKKMNEEPIGKKIKKLINLLS